MRPLKGRLEILVPDGGLNDRRLPGKVYQIYNYILSMIAIGFLLFLTFNFSEHYICNNIIIVTK